MGAGRKEREQGKNPGGGNSARCLAAMRLEKRGTGGGVHGGRSSKP